MRCRSGKNLLARAILLGCSACALVLAAEGQGPNRPGATRVEGPNRPGAGQPGVITQTKKRPPVPLKKGDLFLFTTPEAEVSLARAGRAGAVIRQRADQQGFVLFHNLAPGKYEVVITREDYEQISSNVVIRNNMPVPLAGPLISKFGDVTLYFDKQSTSEVKVALDGEPLPSDRLQHKKGEIVIPRVPVGPHRIDVVKEGYEKWSKLRFDVMPGNVKVNFLVADLERATVALTVRTNPGASIYLVNNSNSHESKGIVPSPGELLIQGLLPGTHTLRVSLEGYEDAVRTIPLALDQRMPFVPIELEPVTEDADGDEGFDPDIDNWYPSRPPEWKMDKDRGMLVSGANRALFIGPRKRNHPIGYHGDFKLILRLKLINGKGVSWIAHARDNKNYYRFDLVPAGRDSRITFFVCREGKCEKKRSFDVMIDLTRPEDELTIELRAEGNQFRHLFSQSSLPRTEMTELGGVFADETLKIGGVGLCAVGEAEFYLQQFTVIPKKKQ